MKNLLPSTSGNPRTAIPTGFWKVCTIIATRLPANQLIWLAVILCIFILIVIGIATWGVNNVVHSEPVSSTVRTLVEGAKQVVATKAKPLHPDPQ